MPGNFLLKNPVPAQMTAVFINPDSGKLFTRRVDVPVPGKGEVLIKMTAAPVNPSDLAKVRETGAVEAVDFIPGIEGCGIVVAAGKGILPGFFLGKRVACSSKHKTSGTWAEYMVTPAGHCFPLSKKIPDEQAAMMLVNPMTALAFLDIARKGKHKAVILSAAASALGKMISILFEKHHIDVLNIVRSDDAVSELQKRGCRHILKSTEDDFPEKVKGWCAEMKAKLMFDAVGGELVNPLLDYLPVGSTIILFGNLSQQKIEFLPTQLVRENKKMIGFFLGHWIEENGMLKAALNLVKVNRLLKNGMESKVQAVFTLDDIQKAVEIYEGNMGGGKVIVGPHP